MHVIQDPQRLPVIDLLLPERFMTLHGSARSLKCPGKHVTPSPVTSPSDIPSVLLRIGDSMVCPVKSVICLAAFIGPFDRRANGSIP